METTYLYSRCFGDTLSLPHSFIDIQVEPNEMLKRSDTSTINSCISKLHDNFLYLNAQTKISDNNLPHEFIRYGYLDNYEFSWNTDVYTYSDAPLSACESDQSIVDIDWIANHNNNSIDGINLFYISHNRLFLTTSIISSGEGKSNLIATRSVELSSTPFNIQTTSTSPLYNTLRFTRLSAIAIDRPNKFMYVLDNGGKRLYKYDISQTVITNTPIQSFIYLRQVVGGSEGYSSITTSTFFDPVAVHVSSDTGNIYVADRGPNDIKVFSQNLDFLYNIGLSGLDTIADITTVGSTVIALAVTGIIYYITNGVLTRTIVPDGIVGEGEVYTRIVISENNTDIAYIVSNKRIVKKHTSRLSTAIGYLVPYNIDVRTFNSLTICRADYDSGTDFIFATDNGRIVEYQELNSVDDYIDCTFSKFRANIYDIDEISIHDDEFIQHWVYSKAFKKVISNHIELYRSLRYKFEGFYTVSGSPIYSGLQYIDSIDQDEEIAIDVNTIFGVNELVMSGVVNRVLKRIYDLQLRMIDILQERYTNVYPWPTSEQKTLI